MKFFEIQDPYYTVMTAKILVVERIGHEKVPTGELFYNMLSGKQEIRYQNKEFKYESRFCSNCGQLLEDWGKFCSYCGAKFEGEQRVANGKELKVILKRSKGNIMNRLKETRKSRGQTIKQASTCLEIPLSSWSNWENGNRNPNFETWKKLAKYFDVPVLYLMGEDESETDKVQIYADREILEKRLESYKKIISTALKFAFDLNAMWDEMNDQQKKTIAALRETLTGDASEGGD